MNNACRLLYNGNNKDFGSRLAGIWKGAIPVQEVKTKKYKGSLLLKFAVFCFAFFMVSMLVGQQVSINQKKAELEELEQALKEQQVVNDELRYDLDSEDVDSDEYAEKIARRELDYIKPGERVFYNVGGNN